MIINRIYNHTNRELLVVTSKQAATDQNKVYITHRLLPQGVSPHDKSPSPADIERLVAVIDTTPKQTSIWNVEGEFDVHVTEVGVDSSIGAGAPAASPRPGADGQVCVFGLGVLPTGTGEIEDNTALPDPTDAWFYREDEIWVTVLGAGITGLSAAHELVTRGFRVQVIERAHSSPTETLRDDEGRTSAIRFRRGLKSPDVGGIARTQWATQPLERAGAGLELSAPKSDQPVTTPPPATSSTPTAPTPMPPKSFEALHSVHGDAIWFGQDVKWGIDPENGAPNYYAFAVPYDDHGIVAANLFDEISKWLARLGAARSLAGVQLVVVVYGGARGTAVRAAYDRLDQFIKSLPADDTKDPFTYLQILPTTRIDVAEEEKTGVPRVGLMIRLHDDLGLIAGEHGFRFFPGFYRHLRDTMGRTPVYDSQTQTFTPRTALDNLQEVEWQVIADPNRRQQTPFARRPFTTMGGLIEQYRTLRRDIGYRPSDLLRFTLRILRYATSSTYRRRELYETMSWWDFLSLRHLDANPKTDPNPPRLPYGARFKEALIHSPKALVAMGSEFADARTQGNLSVQLLMDQFGLHEQGDSTLNGPTSTAWLANWKTYLEEQGVQFILGEVTKISASAPTAGGDLRVNVDIQFPNGKAPLGFFNPKELASRVGAHYYLSALDASNLARVSSGLRVASKESAFADLSKLVNDSKGVERDLEDITSVGQKDDDLANHTGLADRFQTLTGIQLYYERHVSFANGHIYFAQSPWGLSAISQVQFWGPFGSGHRGRLTGNLSIDIGSWRRDTRKDPKGDFAKMTAAEQAAYLAKQTAVAADDKKTGNLDPNQMTRGDIAKTIEEQIDRCTSNPGNGLRQARYFHLDDFIGFAKKDFILETGVTESRLVPNRNFAPFLINVTGDWQTRPRGEPWSPNSNLSRDRKPGQGQVCQDAWFPVGDGYPVYFNNLVVAGPHMRTFTRMATMEAANESARHAVNTLLDHVTCMHPIEQRNPRDERKTSRADPDAEVNVAKNTTPYGDYCDIWDPEVIEFVDLDFLRTVDKYLMEAGESNGDDRLEGDIPPDPPHLFDILKIDDLPDLLEADKDVLAALEGLGAVLKAFENLNTDELPNMGAAIARARAHVATLFKPY